MAAQATENTAHLTPPPSEPSSETEHDRQEGGHKDYQKSERQNPRPKTETEEKMAEKTPPLNLDASASGPGSAQRDPNKHVARRPKRAAVARAEDHNGPEGPPHQPQDVQQVAPQNRQVQDQSKGGAPSVRLDMDLDVDIDLKAKIKGDIELSILGGKRGGR
ncbi:hypothetical protein LZ31DRAFT_552484 [Colletotrichum somersetense]|nr:hypothetical protein LZ31DRAFT_552484 [Colletotrichum somersetense]